jgi:transposase-like protein
MKRQRRTSGEWQEILAAKATRGLTDKATAAEFGVSVASLANWRRRLAADDSAGENMVEVTGLLAPAQVLRIHLTNGIRIDAQPGWPLEQLGRIAMVLATL